MTELVKASRETYGSIGDDIKPLWKSMSREEKSHLVATLHSKGHSIRTIASLIGISKSYAHSLLVFSRIPVKLRDKYSYLSTIAFLRASRSNNLEQSLEIERAKAFVRLAREERKKRQRMIQEIENQIALAVKDNSANLHELIKKREELIYD